MADVVAAWGKLVKSAHPEWAMEALRAREQRLLQSGALGNEKHPQHAEALGEYRAIVKHILEVSARESAHGV